jgi:hypothetical protein
MNFDQVLVKFNELKQNPTSVLRQEMQESGAFENEETLW